MSGEATGRALSVLHVGPTPFFSDRGCHIRIAGLMRGLHEQGVGGALCTYHHGRDVPGIDTLRISTVPGYDRVEAGPTGLKYVADALLFFKVLGVTLRRRPDLLHGHLHEGALLSWAVSRLLFWRRLPVVFDVQGSLSGELDEYGYAKRGGWRSALFERVERFIDHRADVLACSSAAALQIARDRFGVAEDRLYEVPDGIDAEAIEHGDRAEARHRLGIPEGATVVVYSGSLIPAKGVETLHELIAACSRRALGVRFLLIGYPVQDTERFLAAQGLQDTCTLTGRLPFEQLGTHLAAADIAVDPKDAESGEASGKLLNYMAAGLPVVAWETPNSRKILGQAGCYASLGSIDSLVEAVVALSNSAQRRAQLGGRARARVAEQFTWSASVHRLLDIYRALLVR